MRNLSGHEGLESGIACSLSPMSASVRPLAAPPGAAGELRSQPLYHSRGRGSFSGTAYSVPGVSQRSACAHTK